MTSASRRPAPARPVGRGLRRLLPVLLALAGAASAAPAGPAAEGSAAKSSLIAIPIVYYTPETRWALGAGGLWTFRLGGRDAARRPSAVTFSAIVTQNRQFSATLNPEVYFGGDRWLSRTTVEISRFPNTFYGIGRDAPAAAAEDCTPRQDSFETSLVRRWFAALPLYAGAIYAYDRYRFVRVAPGGALASGAVPGSAGGTVAGAGLLATWDDRDNIFTPRRGTYAQLTCVFHGKAFGSGWRATKLKADARRFVQVLRSHVLALQALCESWSGDVPFMAMPRLGGEKSMRGYYKGRYRDKVYATVQAEYRLPLVWRFGLAAFAAAGDAAPRPGALDPARARLAWGGGVRFKVSPREGATIRLDYGRGRGTSGIYFTYGEAF